MASTISNEQNYTIATNGNVWRALQPFVPSLMAMLDTPTTSFTAQFNPTTDHPTDTSTINVLDRNTQDDIMKYSSNTTNHTVSYMLLPGHNYTLQITNGTNVDKHDFLTGDPGTNHSIQYSLASITFNPNVYPATLTLTKAGGSTDTFEITSSTITIITSKTFNWTISKAGYSSVSGAVSSLAADQTINVTLDEES